jgi:hypothetical protein
MDALVIVLVFLLMIIGVIGSVLPFVPGSPLILAGAVLYAWQTDFTVVSWGILSVLAGLMILSQLLEYIASTIGAKRYGASKWGIAGAFIGGIVGIFFGGIIGILIGPFLGAVIFEVMQGRAMDESLKIGFGTFIGFIGGTIGKFIIALTMVGVFLAQVLRS